MKINSVNKTISLLLVLTLLFGTFVQPVMASSNKGNKKHNQPESKIEQKNEEVTQDARIYDNSALSGLKQLAEITTSSAILIDGAEVEDILGGYIDEDIDEIEDRNDIDRKEGKAKGNAKGKESHCDKNENNLFCSLIKDYEAAIENEYINGVFLKSTYLLDIKSKLSVYLKELNQSKKISDEDKNLIKEIQDKFYLSNSIVCNNGIILLDYLCKVSDDRKSEKALENCLKNAIKHNEKAADFQNKGLAIPSMQLYKNSYKEVAKGFKHAGYTLNDSFFETELDTDDDGVSDGYELLHGTNPFVADVEPIEYIDLPDGKINSKYLYNAIYPNLYLRGLSIDNILLADDYDNDGLNLEEEYEYDTNPFSEDTDNDGINEYDEITIYNTNPLKWDTDNDGLGDGTEITAGLNPLLADTDGNGIIDSQEVVAQNVRVESINTINIEETLVKPSVKITGKGDFSRKLYVEEVQFDETILDIDCMIGTAFDFVHDDNLDFESSELTFEISDEILQKNKIEDLAIAYYDEGQNILQLLDTTYDTTNKTLTAPVEHFSKYLVVNVPAYFFNNDWENDGSIITSGKADVVFVVDTTGSMGGPINNVRTSINQFVTELEENKVDIRLGLVEYRDIYADGVGSTKSYDWYTDVSSFKTKLGSLGISGGGDIPESAVDALYCAQNMAFRTGVKKYIILVTDADYKNGIAGNPSATMQDEIEKLLANNIVTSVVTRSTYFSAYNNLVTQTGGVSGNILNNFAIELRPLITKMGDQVNDGCWIRLSNGSIVKLDKDPTLGDEMIDTDSDGIPDVIELKSNYKVSAYNPYSKKYELIDTWTFYSNPIKKDTDGDGIIDVDDLNPCKFDTVIIENTDSVIKFNTGRSWNNISCNSFDYLDNFFVFIDNKVDNPIPLEQFQVIVANVLKNSEQNFSIDELTAIGLINNEGSKLYMHDKTDSVKETVFQRITDRESKYYKHSGILWWSNWEEVPKGTEGGFFRGAVLSEADINFSLDLYYVCDVYTVLDTVARIGAIVIAVIVIVKATPVVFANIQGIIYYCKTYGIFEGLKMYTYLGIQNLPNGVITWIQMDMADGDSSVDDIASAMQAESVRYKLETYLLNKDHAKGKDKAIWFESALGFNKTNMTDLAKQIVFNEQTAWQTAVTEYGTKYNQIITIIGANGNIIDVKFAWIKNLDGVIRLVTGVPAN